MQKEIKKDKGSFVIGYWQTSDDIDLYIGNNHSDPIKVFFYPNIKMTEQECKNYTKDFIPKLENEMVFIFNALMKPVQFVRFFFHGFFYHILKNFQNLCSVFFFRFNDGG